MMSISAFATDVQDEYSSITELDNDTLTYMLMEQLPYDEAGLLEAGLIDSSCLGRTVSTPGVARATATTTVYGPYTNLNMPSAIANIVIDSWDDGNYTSVDYGGYSCLKFEGYDPVTDDNMVIYIRQAAFYPSSTSGVYDSSGGYPSDSAVSAGATGYLNEGIYSHSYFSSKWRVWRSGGVAHVQMVLFGTKAGYTDANTIILEHAILNGTNDRLIVSTQPTMKLGITNAGSGGRYISSFKMEGVGTTCSVGPLQSLINIGIAAGSSIITGQVSGLVTTTLEEISSTAFTVNRTTVSSDPPISNFSTLTGLVSDPGLGNYVYSLSL